MKKRNKELEICVQAWKMARCIKHFPCKHRDLSLDFQHLYKHQADMFAACIKSTQKAETKDPPGKQAS